MNKCKRLLCLLLTLATVLSICAVGFTASAAEVEVVDVSAKATPTSASDFTWDNATVYFLLTDRFQNGNTSNDNSYNRGLNENGSKANYNNVAAFQGGDFKGITQKIKEGYFDDLGVNAIWVAGWFEQTHGYVVGGDGKNSFAHYAYHGYYGLDFTELDKNYGTEAEFKEMITTAHEHGIRIVLDVVLNHPGYNSIYDMNEYNFGTLTSNWKNVYYNWNGINQDNYHGCIKYNDGQASDWARWWGRDWLRAGMAGYDNNGHGNPLTEAVTFLPDFKTESSATVQIPELLKTKWTREGTYNAKVNEINETFSKYNLGNKTVSNYLIAWYAKWVEEYGIDGFRCDTAKHVDKNTWGRLSAACTKALENWRKANPSAVGADWDEEFWTTGEHFDKGLGKDDYYTTGGFDSMINFSFSGNSVGGNTTGFKRVGNLNQTYADYAGKINTDDSFNALTYISSHDTGLCRDDLYYQGSALLLLPGGVQIYYGDETNRSVVQCSINDHAIRGFMNWNSMDKNVLAHWQKVGSFRNNHVAVGAGSHKNLSATSGTAFARMYDKGGVKDTVVCVISANKNSSTTITLSGAFADGTKVVNAYTGDKATVSGGKVTFNSGAQGTILVEVDSSAVEVPTTTPVVKPTEAPSTAPVVKPTEGPTTAPVVKPTEVPTTAPVGTDPSETTPIVTIPPASKPTTDPTTAPVVTPAEKVILGDADLNNQVSIKDATLIQKDLAKIVTLDEKATFAGDVDGNKTLSIKDVTYIQKHLAQMTIEFAVGEEVVYKEGTIVVPTTTVPKATETTVVTVPTTATEPKETTVVTEPVTTEPIVTQPIETTPTTPNETLPNVKPLNNKYVAIIYCEAFGEDDASRNKEVEFASNGTLTFDFPATSYVFVRNYDTGVQYCTDGWSGGANPVTLINQANLTATFDKMLVPAGQQTLYLIENGDDTLTLGYGGSVPDIPDDPDIPDIPDIPDDPTGNETIYFVDGTPEGWIGDADAKIYIFNYETNENYAGTMQDENTWAFQVPAGMTAINFYRCEGEFTQTAWNSWTMCVTIRSSENTFTATGNEAGSWTGTSNGGNNNPPIDNPPVDNPTEGDYIYFTDNQGWGTVYCHTWNMDGGTTVWPGTQMEFVDGKYRAMVDGSHTKVKFNGGLGGPESGEFDLVLGNSYSN